MLRVQDVFFCLPSPTSKEKMRRSLRGFQRMVNDPRYAFTKYNPLWPLARTCATSQLKLLWQPKYAANAQPLKVTRGLILRRRSAYATSPPRTNAQGSDARIKSSLWNTFATAQESRHAVRIKTNNSITRTSAVRHGTPSTDAPAELTRS